MISRPAWQLACLAALLTSTTDAHGPKSVTVHVLTDGQHCTVYSQQMRCDALGAYLRDHRRVAFSQAINIIVDGTGEDSRARGLRTRDYLTKIGYSKIVVVGFITEPSSPANASP
jgi:hypothetical protein